MATPAQRDADPVDSLTDTEADDLVRDWERDGRASSSANCANVEWPTPLPLGPGAPEPYPLDLLPLCLGDQVRSVADSCQVPADLPFLVALAAVSVTCANKARVTVRPGHVEPAHLWIAAVLPPGSRKSPAFGHMTRPLFDWQDREVEHTAPERRRLAVEREMMEKRLEAAKRQASRATTDEAAGELRQEVLELNERLAGMDTPSVPRLLASDVTAERLAQLMAENAGRIGVLAPEGDLFRQMSGRYSGVLELDHWKRGWTGDEPIRDDRMGREGSYVRRPALTLGLTLQPGVLERLESRDAFRDEGLFGRFLYAVPDSMIGSRLTGADVPAIDLDAQRSYAAVLQRLLDAGPARMEGGEYVPHELGLTGRARNALFAFEADVEAMLGPGGILEHVRDWGAKLIGQAVRTAVLLHAADRAGRSLDPWGADIDADWMEAAIEIARAAIGHALVLFDALDADPDVALARYVLGRLGGWDHDCTKRELFERVKGKRGLGEVSDLDRILAVLEARHLVRVVDVPSAGPGRPPSPRVMLSPRAPNALRTIRRNEPEYLPGEVSANTANRAA